MKFERKLLPRCMPHRSSAQKVYKVCKIPHRISIVCYDILVLRYELVRLNVKANEGKKGKELIKMMKDIFTVLSACQLNET